MRFDIYKLQRFNFILDTVSEGWWDNNFETGRIYWNANLFKMLGIDRGEDFVDMDYFLSVVHPDDAPKLNTEFERCVRENKPFEYELRMKHSDGYYITCITRARGYYDDDGKVIGYSGLVTNLTERVKDEAKLKRTNEQLRSLVKVSSVITSKLKLEELVQEVTDITTELAGAEFGAFFYNITDEKGEYLTLYTISGASKEAFAKFPMPRKTEIFAPTYEATGTVISDDILKDPRYGKSAPHHGMPKGHLPVRSYLAVPVVYPNGEPVGGLFYGHSEPGKFAKEVIPLIEGIAAQAGIAIENARLFRGVEVSEANFRMLAESIPQIVAIINPNGVPEYVNKRYFDYTGLTMDEVKQRKGSTLLHPDDRDHVMKKWQESLETGKNFNCEFRFKHVDGQYKWHLSRGVPIRNNEGVILKWVTATTDIDAQKKEEEKKDEFMGIASHELKTPLTSVKAYMQLIQKVVKNTDDQRLVQYVSKANENIDKLTAIISDLLDVSRIQSGKLEMNFSSFNLDKLIEEVAEGMQYMSYNHEILIENNSRASVVADPSRIEQVLVNFLSNAIKYSPQGGKIIVSSALNNGNVRLSVKDHGIGISEKDKERIFEKYFRGENINGEFSGIGIGLYISREIIKRHKGAIWVESEEGKGSTFHFEIPAGANYEQKNTNL